MFNAALPGAATEGFSFPKSITTSLSPGIEIRTLSRSRGDLLDRIDSFTLLGEE